MQIRTMKTRVRLLLAVLAVLIAAMAGSALAAGDRTDAAPSVANVQPVALWAGESGGAKDGAAGLAAQPKATRVPAQVNGLPTITLDRLPREALVTLILILRDGPYPYDKDGATFQNRERLLPRKSNGYYREYTVITPGENDRGARRIIAGERDEFYYTDDHYDSFKWIYLP